MQNKVCAIHQPNFFPWLGYFYKIKNSDIFVFHDDTEISKKAVTRRVKFNSKEGDWWASIPTNSKSALICEIEISQQNPWKDKLYKRIQYEYQKAPFFDKYIEHFHECLYDNENNLSKYNINGIKKISELLGLENNFILSSSLELNSKSTEKEIETLLKVEANEYLSGMGAHGYQVDELFKENKLKLKYTNFNEPSYFQVHNNNNFGLSVWDALFNIGKDEVNKIISNK